MVNVTHLSIKIIDTFENDRVLIVEKTEKENPRFVYNGAEDKFQNVMTSEMSFNFLVTSANEGVFFHLFTGNQNRYKVVLEDTTDAENPVPIWTGFLLAEQFFEPYIYADYFVEMIATDGIALLKDSELSVDYYNNQKSVIDIIFKCLLQTGNNLPLLFAPAIENAGFDLNYKDLEVLTKIYDENNKKKAVYDVLLGVVTSIGCKLFQYNNQWMLIGLNRLNQVDITFSKYVANASFEMEYIEDVTLSRMILNRKFFSNPSISVIPSLRKMTSIWNKVLKDSLIPEDVVSSMPLNIESNIDDRTSKYWTLAKLKNILFLVWLNFNTDFDYNSLDFNTYYNGFVAKPTSNINDVSFGPNVFFNNLNETIVLSDLDTHFAYLSDAFFVKGSNNTERFATLEISFDAFRSGFSKEPVQTYLNLEGEITAVTNNAGKARFTSFGHGLETGYFINLSVQDKYKGVFEVVKVNDDTFDIDINFVDNGGGNWKINPFKNQFHFAITRKNHKTQSTDDEVLYVSNLPMPGIPDGLYDFEFAASDNGVKGTLKIEKIAFLEDGYYNIRLYPMVSNSFLNGIVVYDNVSLVLEQEEEREIINERNIAFKTSNELTVLHADDQMKTSDARFVFSDAIQTAAANGTLIPLEIEVVERYYQKTPVYSNGALWYTLYVIGLSDQDYTRIQNGYEIFILKDGEAESVVLNPLSFSVVDTSENGKAIVQFKYEAAINDFLYVEAADTLFLKINTNTSNTIDYAEHWAQKWKRFGVDESIGFLEALNLIYLGNQFEYNLKITGEYTCLISPFDLIDFTYKGKRRYMPVNLELNLKKGSTVVTLIESKYKNIAIDAADEVIIEPTPEIPVVLNPSITIEATAIEPSLFFLLWQIQVNYLVVDIPAVNATIVAKQLTDSIANGGVPTGFQKITNVTNSNGAHSFVFSLPLEAEAGWYEISMFQDGIISNLEYVELAAAVVETEWIEIASVWIGDILNVTGRYSVSYIGFTPTTVTQRLQKFDASTQSPIGSPIDTTISAELTMVDVAFPESGSWKITLLADGKTSNEVAWLSIQVS